MSTEPKTVTVNIYGEVVGVGPVRRLCEMIVETVEVDGQQVTPPISDLLERAARGVRVAEQMSEQGPSGDL